MIRKFRRNQTKIEYDHDFIKHNDVQIKKKRPLIVWFEHKAIKLSKIFKIMTRQGWNTNL